MSDASSNPISAWTDLVYARRPERELRLDVRVPKHSANPPLVIYIPMRGLRKCDKASAPLWLLESGFAVASIEARVSSEAIAPHAVYDCKAAIRWLRSQASQFGFNGNAIGVWGHSAGGLLASLMATSAGVSELEGDIDNSGVSSAVQAACDECGAPHDLSEFARPEIYTRYSPVAENLRLYLGAPVGERLELARLVSPATYVSATCPPVFLIHGDADVMVPVDDTIAFHRTLRDAGVDATLRILPGTGHGWADSLTRDEIAAFFKRTLHVE